MSRFTYSIVVSDTDPLVGAPENCLLFEERSYRRAHKRMEDAMSRGYYVSCCREVNQTEWDTIPEAHTAKKSSKKGKGGGGRHV